MKICTKVVMFTALILSESNIEIFFNHVENLVLIPAGGLPCMLLFQHGLSDLSVKCSFFFVFLNDLFFLKS